MTLDERIIKVPDPRLRERWPEAALDISQHTLEQMFEWSADHANYGWGSLAGLSSVQVTEPGRAITWLYRRHADGDGRRWNGCIDPVIIKRSYELRTQSEGCYSIHDVWVHVQRPRDITIEGIDIDGNRRLFELTGETAGFAQHELDHLDGILITDYDVPRR